MKYSSWFRHGVYKQLKGRQPLPTLYIIAGCNGAGKTTASYTILPEILNCNEFVNADDIATDLFSFNPAHVAFTAGRIMLNRIYELLERQSDFAFETTLSTLSYVSLIKAAHLKGYKVSLLYFWLSSPDIAVQRVVKRVGQGGHHIPADVIERRYYRGIRNLHKLYIPICDEWTLVNNMDLVPEVIAKCDVFGKAIFNNELWNTILAQRNHGRN